jgi:hypothetical protein
VLVNTPCAESSDKIVDLWQGMPAGHSSNDRPREIALDIGKDRSWNMCLLIIAPPTLQIAECKAAIDDRPVRILNVSGKVTGRYQRRKRHIVSSNMI